MPRRLGLGHGSLSASLSQRLKAGPARPTSRSIASSAVALFISARPSITTVHCFLAVRLCSRFLFTPMVSTRSPVNLQLDIMAFMRHDFRGINHLQAILQPAISRHRNPPWRPEGTSLATPRPSRIPGSTRVAAPPSREHASPPLPRSAPWPGFYHLSLWEIPKF